MDVNAFRKVTHKYNENWISYVLMNSEYTFNASHYDAIKKSLNLNDSGNKMAHYKRILKNNIL